MKKDEVHNLHYKYHKDRKAGVKHTPLHTLAEIMESLGLTRQHASLMMRYHPEDVPSPAVKHNNTGYYNKAEVLAWFNKHKGESK